RDDRGPLRRRARAGAAAQLLGVTRGGERRDLDDQARAARALHAAGGARHEPVALLLPRRRPGRRWPCDPGKPSGRAAPRTGRRADRRPGGDRGAAAAGQADRRAGRPLRPVRDEHARGDPAGDRRLPAHRFRRLALGERRPRAQARGRPLRPPPRRQDGAPGLICPRSAGSKARAALLPLALLALVPACALGAALYQPPRPAQLTVDVDAASIGFTYAPRVSERVLVGGGGGFGLSPFLGTTFATGSHFDAT